ncbi:hypothetical protein D3C77_296040 [compost metagenome]
MHNREVFHVKAKMLACDIFQMMRFIDDEPLIARQELMPRLDVRKQLRMVRNHDIGYACFMFGSVVVAFPKPRAGAAEA